MSIIKEFKEFAFRGNVLDMAVGVVIGTAFGSIVTSLVNHIITPICGILLKNVQFTEWKIPLDDKNAIMIGNFIQSFVDFIIIALAIFMFVKVINKLQRKKEVVEEEKPKAPTTEELLSEIRDLLKEKN